MADDPETARIKQNTQIQSNVNYWGVKDTREQMETKRPTETVDDGGWGSFKLGNFHIDLIDYPNQIIREIIIMFYSALGIFLDSEEICIFWALWGIQKLIK